MYVCIYVCILSYYSIKTIVTVGYFFLRFYDDEIALCYKTSESGGYVVLVFTTFSYVDNILDAKATRPYFIVNIEV